MLQQRERDYLRNQLTRQLEDLMGKAAHTGRGPVHDTDKQVDLLDRAAFGSSRGTTLRLRDRETLMIRKIEGALRRLEDGTFGICEICGDNISVEGLKARPVTTHCMRCRIKMENDERLHMIPFVY